jgi:hypothetical protein
MSYKRRDISRSRSGGSSIWRHRNVRHSHSRLDVLVVDANREEVVAARDGTTLIEYLLVDYLYAL